MKLRELRDNFTGTALQSWWTTYTGGVTVDNGRMRIPVINDYAKVSTDPIYDFTDTQFQFRITPPDLGNESREVFGEISIDTNNRVSWVLSGAYLIARKVEAGVTTTKSVDFSLSDYHWLRIVEKDGVLQWFVSYNGWNWFLVREDTHGMDFSAVSVTFQAGYFGTEVPADAFISDINTVPPIELPDPTVLIGFDYSGPNKYVTWTDVTEFVNGFNTSRGRNNELDSIQTGTMKVSLDNADGRFTPGRPRSTYSPNVIPNRPIKVQMTLGNNLLPADVASSGDITESGKWVPFAASNSYADRSTGTAYEGQGSIEWGIPYLLAADDASVYTGQSYGETKDRFINVATEDNSVHINHDSVYTAAVKALWGYGDLCDIQLGIAWYDVKGAFLSTVYSAAKKVSATDYQTWTVTGTAPTLARYARLTVRCHTSPTVYTGIRLDAWTLTEGDTEAVWTEGSGTYPLFTGYIEQWNASFESGGDYSDVEISCVDYMARLADYQVGTPYQQSILIKQPLLYLPLYDDGASTLTDLAGKTGAVSIKNSSNGGTPITFKSTGIVGLEETEGTSVLFGKQLSSNAGQLIVSRDGTLMSTLGSYNWSIECWVKTGIGTLFDGVIWSLMNNNDYASGVRIYIDDSTGNLSIAAGSTALNTGIYIEGLQTQVVVQCTVVGPNVSLDVYINGVYRKTLNAPRTSVKTPTTFAIGGYWNDTLKTVNAPVWGNVGHVSVSANLSLFTEVAERYKTGKNARYNETENTRFEWLGGIIEPARHIKGDTSSGSTGLLGVDWTAGSKVLEQFQRIASNAQGYLFVDAGGNIVFHSKSRRTDAEVKSTFAESLSTGVEPGLQFVADSADIVNDVLVSRKGGGDFRETNQVSIDKFGRKSDSFELEITSDTIARNTAKERVAQYSSSVPRCDQIQFDVSTSGALPYVLLRSEIGNKVRLEELPDTAPYTEMEFFIESISHQIQKVGGNTKWTVTMNVSPVTQTVGWIAGDAQRGILGTTTVAAY